MWKSSLSVCECPLRVSLLCTFSDIPKRSYSPCIFTPRSKSSLDCMYESHCCSNSITGHCVGQLASDFQIQFQKEHHQNVLPALLCVLENDPSDRYHSQQIFHSYLLRVKSHAAAAVVNFCEDCPVSSLKNYLDALLNTLSAILNRTDKEFLIDVVSIQYIFVIKFQCIAAVASIADCAGKLFTKAIF